MQFCTRLALLCYSLFIIINTSVGQTKLDAQYKQTSEELRKEIWAWDMPAFKVREVSAEYAKVSKVIMAHHTELLASQKTNDKLIVRMFQNRNAKELSFVEIVRQMVKVNDKTAVDDYSEFSFTKFESSRGYRGTDNTTNYIGARIIKPNGTVKEINTDEIVLTKDSRDEKNAKLAIADLEPGDIIDYYTVTEVSLRNNLGTKEYNIILFDEAPVMHQSFHAEFSKHFNINYSPYNGSPDLTIKHIGDDIDISLEQKNIPAFETRLWTAAEQQLPFIRIYFIANNQPDITKGKKSSEVFDNAKDVYASWYYNSYVESDGRKSFAQLADGIKKLAKNTDTRFKDMNDEQKALFVYYATRYMKILDFDINAMERTINSGDYSYDGLTVPLHNAFIAADLLPAIIIGNKKNGYKADELMRVSDLTSVAYIPSIKKYFAIESIYDVPFFIPQDIEGSQTTKEITFKSKGLLKIGAGRASDLATMSKTKPVPLTTSKDNARIDYLKITIPEDETKLAVTKKSVLKGYYKSKEQSRLILYEDYYEHERKLFKEPLSLVERLEESKRGKKYVDEVKSAFAEARKKQKQSFIDEAKEWYEQEVTEMKDFSIETLGVRHDAPDFVFHSTFQLDGMVKKAGNNYIVELGKLPGEPFVIKPEQRNRKLDIHMPYARSIEYHVTFTVPEGYKAEGVEGLNKSVSNETGFFTAEAKELGNNQISLTIKRHFLSGFEKNENWQKILAFLDAANEWHNAKLLLKKL